MESVIQKNLNLSARAGAPAQREAFATLNLLLSLLLLDKSPGVFDK
jgi:hypothetical protein